MAWASLKSMAHDDDQLYDLAKGMPKDWDPPQYPGGLCFSLSQEDVEWAGGDVGEPGDSMRFSAIGTVTSVFRSLNDSRIELQLTQMAGEDGKFTELSAPACICLCGPELEKLGLDDDAERGDMIHLIGTARLESVSSSEWGGERVSLQVVELTYEDESSEVREA